MKKFLALMMLTAIIIISFPSEILAAGGLLQGKSFVGDFITNRSRMTDGNMNTYAEVKFGATYTFPNEVTINRISYKGSQPSGSARYSIDFYNSFHEIVYKIEKNGTHNITLPNPITIKRITVNFNPDDIFDFERILNVYDIDVFEYIEPPVIPTGLTATSLIESVQLNWTANPKATGFNIYKNSEKINESPIEENTYLVESLIPDQNIGFQITSLNANGQESLKTSVVYAAAMSQPNYPVLTFSRLNVDSLRLNWEGTATTYEVYQDDALLESTIYKFLDITKLEPAKEYEFKVVAIDKYGRRNESNLLRIETLALKPGQVRLKIEDKTYDAFKLTWQDVEYATDYTLYFQNELIGNFIETSYEFNGLEPDTLYFFRVVANNAAGTSEASGSTRTDKKPIPEILKASVSPISGQPTKRSLDYVTNDLVTAIKVYLNGEFVGEYPVTQNSIELDFSDITEDKAKIIIEPVDLEGKSLEVETFVKGTGDSLTDNILLEFLKIFGINKKAFWFIALTSISLLLASVLFFFIRRQYKKMFGETNKDSRALINQPQKPLQHEIDIKEAKRKFIPWKEMTEEQQNEWRASKGKKPYYKKQFTESEKLDYRSKKHEAKTGFKIVDRKVINNKIGFMGMSGTKQRELLTYERNGVQYHRKYVKGQGMSYVPKDFANRKKLVSNQFKAVKSAFTGSNKKFN